MLSTTKVDGLGEVNPTRVIRTTHVPAEIIEICTLMQVVSGLMLRRDGDGIDELPEITADVGRRLAEDADEWDQ